MPPAKRIYTHQEWKYEYDQYNKLLHNVDHSTQKRYLDKIIKLELSGRHHEYFFRPRVLLESLLQDTQELLISYDKTNLRDQSNQLRFFMLKMKEMRNEIQTTTRDIMKEAEIIRYCQEQYDHLCAELAYAFGLLEDDNFCKQLQTLLDQYSIEPNVLQHSLLSSADLTWLRRVEVEKYKAALSELQTIVKILPNESSTKQDAMSLIKKIERNRNYNENPPFWFKQKPFDYKRQAINLSKTNELIKHPMNLALHDEYQQLIQSNNTKEDMNINTVMSQLLFGMATIVLCTGFAVMVGLIIENPPALAILLLVVGEGAGVGLVGKGAVNVIKQKTTTTATCMSRLFSTVVKPEQAEALSTNLKKLPASTMLNDHEATELQELKLMRLVR